MINISNLHFQYDKYTTETIKGINLTVSEGEFVAVLGHNGSGKSTLAKLINGLLIPSEGSVLVDDIDTSKEEEFWNIRKKVGIVFQNPDNQLIATSVEEDTAFGPENLGLPKEEIRERIHRALYLVGMEKYSNREVHFLSGGQKQRVAIAGVMAMRPKYLVLDEPTAMLDPKGRKEVLNAVIDLNKKEKITVIYITHIMEEALFADRIILMNEGLIELSGPTREVLNNVDALKKCGLNVPYMSLLAQKLRDNGFNIGNDILTREDMVKALCQLK